MKRVILLFTLLLYLFGIGVVSAQNDKKIAEQKRIIATLEKQVVAGEKEVSNLRKGKADKEKQVQSLASQIQTRNRLLTAQSEQVKLLQEQIDQSDVKYRSLSKELDAEKGNYAEMIREAYRNYRNNDLMSYLFTSENFIDVARKIVNLRAMSTFREERMAQIEGLATEVSNELQKLNDDKKALDVAVKDLENQKSNLEKDQQSARTSIASMSAREKKVLQERELQKRKLDSAINTLRKLSKGNTTGASFSAKTSNLNLPVVGGRVKRYVDNMAEVTGGAGAKIVSIYEGKVVDITHNRITGKYDVYIAHGEYITSYAGLESVAIAKGGTVTKNQTIGVIGQSVDIITMQSEYKIVFGIYPPNPSQKLKAADCFKK
ncbi:MAG: peptidoglycan DD-metalloendopeptidase family protein [Rikenellaceae bacterium]